MNVGPWQLIIIALVILVLFGRGKISEMMGDFGKGIKSFKQGMNDESGKDMMRLDPPRDPAPAATAEPAAPPATPVPAPVATPAATSPATPVTSDSDKPA